MANGHKSGLKKVVSEIRDLTAGKPVDGEF